MCLIALISGEEQWILRLSLTPTYCLNLIELILDSACKKMVNLSGELTCESAVS